MGTHLGERRFVTGRSVLAVMMTLCLAFPGLAAGDLQGQYKVLDGPSKHSPGKVKLYEFADFYCPHCHQFEQSTIPDLKQEFGDRLEVIMVGFPVIGGKLPTPFEMYEQAKRMGKGPEMKRVLFRAIHQDGIEIFDRTIRSLLVREVGLDVQAFEEGMKTGDPYRSLQKGKQWGEQIGVSHTPTIVLDGNIKVENISSDNLKTVIQSILSQDQTS